MNATTQESRKMAAAIAAVFGYIRSQEDAMMMPPLTAPPAVEPPAMAAPVKMWGMSGRQEMMSLRNLMQLRTFQGSKLR